MPFALLVIAPPMEPPFALTVPVLVTAPAIVPVVMSIAPLLIVVVPV